MPHSEFWTERTVAWYARAVARSDFAPRVLAVIGPALDECKSALDVGAGCGALALPLARRMGWVTAVEPTAPTSIWSLKETVPSPDLWKLRNRT